ncbi:hypothetical protein [cyanobacterium endosymbiont of Rhopalodia gibberula]|nr:hypothetical protein [cyanobacterium endosymbiont of Rhopalodia gibberula]
MSRVRIALPALGSLKKHSRQSSTTASLLRLVTVINYSLEGEGE